MTVIDGSIVTVSHLGLISGIIDLLGITECIDNCIPKKRQHKVSHGLSVKALLANCLGFIERRLYVMPDFFEDVAVDRLIGPGIKPEDLNQYLFGETLDKISEYGPKNLFNNIILEILKVIDLGVLRLHIDTTTISVTGEYDSDLNTQLIRLVRGHSKDHRSDLNQFVLALCTDQRGIPLFMEPLSGNESDKKTLLKVITQIRENLTREQLTYHIADSAFYTSDTLNTLGIHCFWISRVPEIIKEAKEIVCSNVEWNACVDPRYKYSVFESSYANIPQKWILFYSEELHKKQVAHDIEKMKKQLEKDQTVLHKMLVKGFACEKDAHVAIERWLSKHPRYIAQDLILKTVNQRKTGGRGRPKKDEILERWVYPSCKLEYNEENVAREQEIMGRFILGSNDTSIDPEICLQYYKEQSQVEKGFRFLKDDSFHVSEVYLENENRIAALSMIMVLCLLIYSFAEWLVRTTLKKRNETIRDQKGKQTQKPTGKWVFQLFRRVRELKEIENGTIICRIVNYTDELRYITRLLGPKIEKYYS